MKIEDEGPYRHIKINTTNEKGEHELHLFIGMDGEDYCEIYFVEGLLNRVRS